MQPWNPYNGYWPSASYTPYNDPNYPTAAQTYDYNHQTAAPSGQSTNPPPPGVESKEETTGGHTPVPSSSSTSWPYGPPNSLTQAASSASYGSPYIYGYGSQHPMLPSSGMYPGYVTPAYPNPNPSPYGWNMPGYNYQQLQQNGRGPPNFLSHNWGYPLPHISASGPRLQGNSANASVSPTVAPTSPEKEVTVQSLQTPPESLKAKGTKEQWSEELKDYVQRAFCSIDTKEEKDQMERILKEKLEYIFRNNIKIDWTKENIPTIPSKTIAAIKSMSNVVGSNTVNVVRPAQLLGPRGARATGPARGSHVRLPVGMLSRGGRNIFASAKTGVNAISGKKIPSPYPSHPRSRSRSRSPLSSSSKPWSHHPTRRTSFSRSDSRSGSSDSHRSSASSSGSRSRPSRRRRVDSRSRSRSSSRRSGRRMSFTNSHVYCSPDASPSPINGGKKTRRRKRGGRMNEEFNRTINEELVRREDGPANRGHGRGGRRGKATNPINDAPGFSASRLSYRANRFKDHLGQSTLDGSGSIARTTSQLLLNMFDERDELSADFESFQIVGTMQELEKRYLRLTRAPEPSEVRPLHVLKQSLEHVKQKWAAKMDYQWVCEQFKSIRQDLTVQGIEDEFAVSVYEAHADAALEAGDFEEFHQCQSQLLRLYKEGAASSRFLEFTAYRLLYYMFTLDLLGINTIMAGLRPTHKSNPCIRFALDLRTAWSLNNYWRFFRLVCPRDADQQPPLRCAQVVHWFLDRERKEAIKVYLKVFRPALSLAYVAGSLGFPDTKHCKEFICKEFSISSDILEPEEKMDCKAIWTAICQAA